MPDQSPHANFHLNCPFNKILLCKTNRVTSINMLVWIWLWANHTQGSNNFLPPNFCISSVVGIVMPSCGCDCVRTGHLITSCSLDQSAVSINISSECELLTSTGRSNTPDHMGNMLNFFLAVKTSSGHCYDKLHHCHTHM